MPLPGISVFFHHTPCRKNGPSQDTGAIPANPTAPSRQRNSSFVRAHITGTEPDVPRCRRTGETSNFKPGDRYKVHNLLIMKHCFIHIWSSCRPGKH